MQNSSLQWIRQNKQFEFSNKLVQILNISWCVSDIFVYSQTAVYDFWKLFTCGGCPLRYILEQIALYCENV